MAAAGLVTLVDVVVPVVVGGLTRTLGGLDVTTGRTAGGVVEGGWWRRLTLWP